MKSYTSTKKMNNNMGLFGDIVKDILETGSNSSKLRDKFKKASELLIKYSFGGKVFGDELTEDDVVLIYIEAMEIAEKCKAGEKIRLYFDEVTIEVEVPIAMKSFEYWMAHVFDHNKVFTSSLAIELIGQAKSDMSQEGNNKVELGVYENSISKKLPNYIEFINEFSSMVEGCELVTDSDKVLEYKMPILLYGNVMGFVHYIIEVTENGNYTYHQTAIGKNGLNVTSGKSYLFREYTAEVIGELYKKRAVQLLKNPDYIKIATGG